MHDESTTTTFLFTDIEGSTRLWEEEPERMRPALARHDAIARAAVEEHRGHVVKMTGDGLHAAFEDPLDALLATLQLQIAVLNAEASFGIPMRIRCGVHTGNSHKRDNDYYGTAVNRAARVMSAAHGGQMLVSEAVVSRLGTRLPAGVALRDLGLVRLRDLAEPERLYQVIHPQLRADFPPLRSLEATPNNLPHQLTSFIGRERELLVARRLLAGNRLVTIVGMGGMGKSRLALQAAAELVDENPDGVWRVELAALSDARLVVQSVASVLGVVEDAGRPVIEALLRHLKDRKMLILLDNCEHLLAACAQLARAILEAAADVRILATSREPLQIAGEASLPLSALAVPGPQATGEAAALERYESTRLFIERAQAAVPSFHADSGNAAEISALCHRLDGIPLALELAAARVRTMTVRQILERLNDRFRLLASRDPMALPRQRTLQALIDWSHDLLSENERRLLRKLAIFAGGWTVDAAEAVCADASFEDETVLELLSRLVEKSLVVMDAQRERYRLLETVRQYAEARLEESLDVAAVRRRHFLFYLELATAARAELVGPDQGRWLTVLDAERENLLAAHRAVDLAAGTPVEGLQLGSTLKLYWVNRGLLELGERLSVESLARPGAQVRDDARCRALFDAGQLRFFMGMYAAARPLLDESLAIAREMGADSKVAAVLQPLGMTNLGLGDLAAAGDCLREALSLAEAKDDWRGIATAANALGQYFRVCASPDQANAFFERSIAISREHHDREMIAVGLLNSAMVSVARGDLPRAGAPLAEALDIAEELRSRPMLKSALEVCTALAATAGDHSTAARFYGAAEAQGARTGLGRDPADAAFLAPIVEKCAAALGEESFRAGMGTGRAMPYREAMREARALLGQIRAPSPAPCR